MRLLPLFGRLTLVLFVVFGVACVFIYVFSPVDAVAYYPESAPPLTGVLEPNDDLQSARLLAYDQLVGLEDIVIDDQGHIYTSTEDGYIFRIIPHDTGEDVEIFAQVNGRPLGLIFSPSGDLLVANHGIGLQSVNPEGEVTLLTDSVDNTPILFANDVDVSSEGIVYFSDANAKFNNTTMDSGPPYAIHDILEARPRGRLLSYDLATQKTQVLLEHLYFANGVTLTQNEDAVLIAESTRYRIKRYWLKGPQTGIVDFFAENLPGIPDGILSDRNGTIWVTIELLRNTTIDTVLHPNPILKRFLGGLPSALWAGQSIHYGLVVQYDEQGSALRSLHDPTGEISVLSNTVPHDGYLYIGTLLNSWIAQVSLDE